MDAESAAEWLDRYVAAWESYDPEQITPLFSEDIVYRYHPYDKPTIGREAVVESWAGEGGHEGAPDRDEPGTFEASYEPVAVDGDRVVATGSSSYRDTPDGEIKRVYDNCFVMRFDSEGRCAEFTEWFMLRPAA